MPGEPAGIARQGDPVDVRLLSEESLHRLEWDVAFHEVAADNRGMAAGVLHRDPGLSLERGHVELVRTRDGPTRWRAMSAHR